MKHYTHSMSRNTIGSSRPEGGFSLIEVLVALVILSVGMLGVLTLQVKGLQFSQSARISTNAIIAASDMADRIRANPTAGTSYFADVTAPSATPPEPQCADLPDDPVPPGTNCTPAQLAAFDIWLWKDALSRDTGIPEGQGSIDVLTPASGALGTTTYTVKLNYSERGENREYEIQVNN